MKKIFDKIGELLKPIMPNLPTDNLYKFIFIGCLALIAFFYNSLDKRTNDFKQRSYDLDLAFVELTLRDSNLAESYALLDTIFKISKDEKVRERAEIKFESLEIDKGKLSLDFSKYDKLAERVEDEKDELVIYAKKIRCIIILLLTVASISCFFWYYRVQVYEDEILKNKSPKN